MTFEEAREIISNRAPGDEKEILTFFVDIFESLVSPVEPDAEKVEEVVGEVAETNG